MSQLIFHETPHEYFRDNLIPARKATLSNQRQRACGQLRKRFLTKAQARGDCAYRYDGSFAERLEQAIAWSDKIIEARPAKPLPVPNSEPRLTRPGAPFAKARRF